MTSGDDGAAPAEPVEAGRAPDPADPTWERLQDQLKWYDDKSGYSQRRYKWLKVLEIAIAAALPVVASMHSPVWVTGGLAAVVVVLEGIQQIFQYHEHWITYRATAEALKRERYLYLAQAGPYAGDDRHIQLAERVEGLLSQENAKWAATGRREGTSHPAQR
ncbi:MAG TPA: DUF4231 domain-containing protein [Streptosporangiaceae bacterium]|nr:DUF4231 domain-containing protein [Streptosporangiaceae bacterium]